MVYVESYHVEKNEDTATRRLLCDEMPFCPECENSPGFYNAVDARLKLQDRVRRHYKEDGGCMIWYEIPRGVCPICNSIMRILPGFMAPFKHYGTNVMSAYLGAKRNCVEPKDYPSDCTIANWDEWLGINHDELSPYGIDRMRKENCLDDWIGAAVVKARNNGKKLRTVSGKTNKTKKEKSARKIPSGSKRQ